MKEGNQPCTKDLVVIAIFTPAIIHFGKFDTIKLNVQLV